MTQEMMFWLCFYGFFMLVTALVGYHKNNTVAGILLGYVLGPIGLVLILFSQDRRHGHCPHCSAKVDRHAYHCPRCEQKCYKQLV
ncbi:hypothetical protein ACRZ5S_16735 [Vibrio scophthalmi]|uniref:Uncharacterized protein n=1 Tax=Vibrio scophthalmi TaxID=45658 RepID=A0A1E3WEW5_9VIBR|nr:MULTISPECIES: hypothetical protein [Vibrio]EGU36022.1 hypothetical protein VIBRN418_08537 [Vibrio sp. N418]MCY9803694.1 hypothetical protein [Vibrio scophthalmi]ODS04341.1 hypothetical protein VSF3289_03472 [Vibrio scophthalmi]